MQVTGRYGGIPSGVIPPGVIPAKAGIFSLAVDFLGFRIPAFAGMTRGWDGKGVGMTRGWDDKGLGRSPRCQAPWLSLVPRSVATVPDPVARFLAP
jgi:hypothetical protein